MYEVLQTYQARCQMLTEGPALSVRQITGVWNVNIKLQKDFSSSSKHHLRIAVSLGWHLTRLPLSLEMAAQASFLILQSCVLNLFSSLVHLFENAPLPRLPWLISPYCQIFLAHTCIQLVAKLILLPNYSSFVNVSKLQILWRQGDFQKATKEFWNCLVISFALSIFLMKKLRPREVNLLSVSKMCRKTRHRAQGADF